MTGTWSPMKKSAWGAPGPVERQIYPEIADWPRAPSTADPWRTEVNSRRVVEWLPEQDSNLRHSG